jgi:hypothetical protein
MSKAIKRTRKRANAPEGEERTMSPKPKIQVTGELWLNADNMPQLTIALPSGEKLWVQVPSRDTSGNPRASKAYLAAMEALGVGAEAV